MECGIGGIMSVQIKGVGTIGGIDQGLDTVGVITATGLDVNGNGDVSGNLVVGSLLTASGLDINGSVDISGDFSIADKIVHTGDSNTAIRFPADDTIAAETGGSERLRIASDGKITTSYQIVNDTAPDFSFEITQVDPSNTVNQLGGSGVGLVFKPATNSAAAVGAGIAAIKPGGSDGDTTSDLAFYVSQNDETLDEKVRITSGGRLLVGTSTSNISGAFSAVVSTGAESNNGGFQAHYNAGAYGGGSMTTLNTDGGGLDFWTYTGNLGSETNWNRRLRINSTGVVQVMSERLTMGTSVTNGGANDGNFCIEFSSASRNAIKLRDTYNYGSTTYMVLVGGSATVGSITGTTGQAFYNNLSDYRSKENHIKITDGIEKIKLLKPIRFNYKTDPSTLCDGFFAHEVTPAVPTAVTGEKDAVDSDGKIDPQMLDTGKIIPLLTAALQEAIAKIETLESKVATLEGS